MSEIPDPKGEFSADDLSSEFKQLGDNLKKIFIDAWESEKVQNMQNEIGEGLAELGETLKKTAEEIQESEPGQRFKSEAEDFRDRVRSGEVEGKIKSDLKSVLHKLNIELEKAVPSQKSAATGEDEGSASEQDG
ncbi:MAG: hypothetical protein JSV42_17655 [Chloroflexota bacterium]|nr:MAG: hypothetical protein JSV42_17655 [Chloroflexota bacterium]